MMDNTVGKIREGVELVKEHILETPEGSKLSPVSFRVDNDGDIRTFAADDSGLKAKEAWEKRGRSVETVSLKDRLEGKGFGGDWVSAYS